MPRTREKVVRVPWPQEAIVDQMTPRYITVARCSGGCSQVRRLAEEGKINTNAKTTTKNFVVFFGYLFLTSSCWLMTLDDVSSTAIRGDTLLASV